MHTVSLSHFCAHCLTVFYIEVEKHVDRVALTDLYKASYETLRGVTDLGFQVGDKSTIPKFYQFGSAWKPELGVVEE